MAGISVKLPLSYDSNDGPYRLNKTYEEMVQQNLKHLLLTSPGERMLDPLFGVGLRRFLFEQKDPGIYNAISSKIHEQVGKYMPFISINDIQYDDVKGVELFNEPSNSLSIKLFYTIIPLDITDLLALNIDLTTT